MSPRHYLVISVAHFVPRAICRDNPKCYASAIRASSDGKLVTFRAQPFSPELPIIFWQLWILRLSYLEQTSGWSIHCNP